MSIAGIIAVSLLAAAAGVLAIRFRKLKQNLEELRRRAERAEGTSGHVISFLNHDLRASIHGLAGIARLLEKTPCSQEQQEYAQLMRYTALKVHYTAAELVDYHRKHCRQETLIEQDYSPARFFKKESGFLRRYASELGCSVTMELPPERERVIGDRAMLGRLAFALISAAAERSPESRLKLRISLLSSALELRVTADGNGREAGAGFAEGGDIHIGTARVLTSAMGGTLSTEGYAGPYTARIPPRRKEEAASAGGNPPKNEVPVAGTRAPGGEPAESPPREAPPPGVPAGPAEGLSKDTVDSDAGSEGKDSRGKDPGETSAGGLKHPRLLIAEDEVINQFYLKNICSEAGWRADVVGNGRDAVRQFERVRYDLVVLDIDMPILSGIETVRKLRELETGDRTPIIALSAYSEARKTAEYAQAGFDGHLSKPFTERGFYRKVAQFIS